MEGLTIRHATVDDAAACAELWVQFGRALAERLPRFREPEREGLAEWFRDGIAEADDRILRALAELDGTPVGLAHAVLRPPTAPAVSALIVTSLQPRVLLEDLVVAEGARGKGIGEALVRYVEDWGKERGAASIQLNSDADGPARRFYERIGFSVQAAVYGKDL